jgi:3D (Asp-Asp-Asp) domain-containing protein
MCKRTVITVFCTLLLILVYPAEIHQEQHHRHTLKLLHRGTEERPVKQMQCEIYEVTAYTANCESTGKTSGHPLYSITASGTVVTEGQTIAAPPALPFGTKVYIPYFDKVFTVEDRGGAIQGKRLDVYMDSREEALKFGRRNLEVLILD